MGNRGGRFHDDGQRLGARRFASRRWIACLCEFKGRHRAVWGAGYTELFFLDDVTALAAGHRPCFECRRADARAFVMAADAGTSADAIDRQLDGERRDGNAKRLHRARLDDLPDATMIVWNGAPHAVRGDMLLPWSFAGYGAGLARPRGVDIDMLTPPTIVMALGRGFWPRSWAGDAPTG
jgi:hypothetical protein